MPKRKRVFDIADIQATFDRPIDDAAAQFGVCVTVLKKACRAHGIKRWPFRKVQASKRRNKSAVLQEVAEVTQKPQRPADGAQCGSQTSGIPQGLYPQGRPTSIATSQADSGSTLAYSGSANADDSIPTRIENELQFEIFHEVLAASMGEECTITCGIEGSKVRHQSSGDSIGSSANDRRSIEDSATGSECQTGQLNDAPSDTESMGSVEFEVSRDILRELVDDSGAQSDIDILTELVEEGCQDGVHIIDKSHLECAEASTEIPTGNDLAEANIDMEEIDHFDLELDLLAESIAADPYDYYRAGFQFLHM